MKWMVYFYHYVTSEEYRTLNTTNTYDWINATADSSVSSNTCVIINNQIIVIGRLGPWFPSKVRRRCPAIMFAARRIAKVPGRIMFLTVSIKTMNIISGPGVPCGTRWVNIWFIFVIHPNIINLNHKGNANLNVIAMCLVLVNTYGIKPIVLLNMIRSKRGIRILFSDFVFDNKINSLFRVLVKDKKEKILRLGINQYIYGIINNPRDVLIQFRLRVIIDLDGSNTENRFVIMVSFFDLF